ncbi:hypothetical protein QQZ08_010998 [Neonectria magnoliae]|uniref:Myb-like domain-containing protein n=1 Tax=Neonectria magnoliae TaxID=2732573 RepID=A0ABR1HD68_9HYPO
MSNKMSLKFKPYNPYRQEQRDERPIKESDSIPTGGPDSVRDPYANFPSVEECLSFCSSTAGILNPYTLASAYSNGQDSAINIQDNRPNSSRQAANLNISNATPEAMLHRGDLRESYKLPVSISDDARAQGASASELNSGLLTQSAEALGVLAYTAITELESAVGISSAEVGQGPGTETFSSKRPLPEGNVPGESEGHGSEAYRSLKRPRRSGSMSHSSPRLEIDDICPIPSDSSVNRSASQSSQSTELVSVPPEQAEFVRLELLAIQQTISSLLAKLGRGQVQSFLSDGSVHATKKTRSGTQRLANKDRENDSGNNGDSDSDSDSDNDSNSDTASDTGEFRSAGSDQRRSTQRCRWTPKEDELLRRLKNVGTLTDLQIAHRLNRSESGGEATLVYHGTQETEGREGLMVK